LLTPASDEHPFDTGTAFRSIGDGRYTVEMNTDWWVIAGPNGGYLAGMLLRVLEAAVADSQRTPRSLTIHYLRPPAEGIAEIHTSIERTGRSMTTVSARLIQGDRLMAIALAAFSAPRSGPEMFDLSMPDVPPPEALTPAEPHIPLGNQYEQRFLPGSGHDEIADRAWLAAWMRLSPPRAVDYNVLAAYSDSLPPAIFATTADPSELGPLPTIDLTIHFRADLDEVGLAPEDYCLGVCRSQTAREGFIEEDMEIWSPGGVLLAHSRQLALVRQR
jgi:acyl-CoA thioesterase